MLKLKMKKKPESSNLTVLTDVTAFGFVKQVSVR